MLISQNRLVRRGLHSLIYYEIALSLVNVGSLTHPPHAEVYTSRAWD